MNPLRRAGSVLAAVALVTGSTTVAAHADTAKTTPTDTSWIRLDTLSPAVIPAKGTITLTGTLHNGSGETWHHLSVEPATSKYALTNAQGVAYYANYDSEQVHLGSALPTLRQALPDLSSGANVAFQITIPRASLIIEGKPGVYWLGVTPISDEAHPANLTARTFIPLLPKVAKKTRLNVSMVVPLRENPLRLPNGQVADPSGFAALLSPSGRLGRIAQFSRAAGTRPLTWVVDPALLDIAEQTADGVADYGLGTTNATPPPKPSTTPSSPGASPTTAPTHPTHLASDVSPSQAATIKAWSASVLAALKASPSYVLPYGDPVLSTLVNSGYTSILGKAVELSRDRMAARDLAARPAVAPSSGVLTEAEWKAISAGTTAFVHSADQQTPSATSGSRTLIVASPTSDGGPGPVDQQSALDLRQRILSEAALAASTGKTHDLTVVLPAEWDPGTDPSGFFTPLTRPWISFTSLATPPSGSVTLSAKPVAVTNTQLVALAAASSLSATVTQIPIVLATSDADKAVLTRQLQATALSTLSLTASTNPQPYIDVARQTIEANNAVLAALEVEGTQFVTLSGSSGVITMAVHNGLNVPVRFKLQQIDRPVDDNVQVTPTGTMTLEPGERTTVRLDVTAPRVSVQEVTISAVTTTGVPVGTALTFTLRSSPVGAVAWAVTIGVGLIVLLLAARGFRRRRKTKREAQ